MQGGERKKPLLAEVITEALGRQQHHVSHINSTVFQYLSLYCQALCYPLRKEKGNKTGFMEPII